MKLEISKARVASKNESSYRLRSMTHKKMLLALSIHSPPRI